MVHPNAAEGTVRSERSLEGIEGGPAIYPSPYHYHENVEALWRHGDLSCGSKMAVRIVHFIYYLIYVLLTLLMFILCLNCCPDGIVEID
jgi:hypothetical protein